MPKPRTATHGSYSLYADGCRCAVCVQWKHDSDADYRARRRAAFTGRVQERAPDAHIDAQTGEVPMTPGQRKLAELLARNMKPAQTRAATPQVAPDGFERVRAGEE